MFKIPPVKKIGNIKKKLVIVIMQSKVQYCLQALKNPIQNSLETENPGQIKWYSLEQMGLLDSVYFCKEDPCYFRSFFQELCIIGMNKRKYPLFYNDFQTKYLCRIYHHLVLGSTWHKETSWILHNYFWCISDCLYIRRQKYSHQHQLRKVFQLCIYSRHFGHLKIVEKTLE